MENNKYKKRINNCLLTINSVSQLVYNALLHDLLELQKLFSDSAQPSDCYQILQNIQYHRCISISSHEAHEAWSKGNNFEVIN